MPKASVQDLLAAAVGDIEGVERPGQLQMARAVSSAMASGDHLLVQAGTGTGKSLAYLVPALLHGRTVVIATATLALQAQLTRRDLPRLVAAATPVLGRKPRFAILKGRSNYVCLHRTGGGSLDQGDTLFGGAEVELPTSPLGREVVRAREWAATTETGDRDDLSPGVGDRAWAQVSVSSRECLGATRCPQGEACFAELARITAGEADVVVTNHALLAIDALENIPVLPEHKVVIVDEAHELLDRVSAVATAELTVAAIERAVRASSRVGDERAVGILAGVAEGLGATLATVEPGRLNPPPPLLAAELAAVADAARGAQVSISTSKEDEPDVALAKRIARTALEEIVATAIRLGTPSVHDVAWLAVEERRGRVLRVAPLTVAGLLRAALFGSRTVILTSATLAVGGAFEATARSLGLSPLEEIRPRSDPEPERDTAPASADGEAAAHDADGADDADGVADADADADAEDEDDAQDDDAPARWRGLDVGSPFDYRRQGILYVARHLPPPGRDGLSPALLDELTALIDAAGGATLGLFSSRRAAEQAALELRRRLSMAILAQGDRPLNELVEEFRNDTTSCLFGTLSLWQGVDVPGDACRLVVVDRIPFPRPDDPLSAARSAAADAAGGNGFMSVSAAQAAVKLAQGAGRLIRSDSDRGMVAVLDARLATARYSSFLRATLPPLWFTTDRAVALGALRRLKPADAN